MAEQDESKVETMRDDRTEDETKGRLSLAIDEMSDGKRPSLKWLFIMLLIEFAAFAMLIPIFPFFLIHELGLGPTQVGQLLSAFSLAQLIGASACGRLSDATGRRYVIIAVFAWAGIGFGATALVTTFAEVLVVRAMQGLSGGTAALCDAYILDLVPSYARASYMGLGGAVKGMAFVLGPGVGALLIVGGLARRTVFLITGGLALLAAGLGLAFLDESLVKEKRQPLCGEQESSKKDTGAEAANWEGINAGLLCIWFARFTSALGLGFMFATYAFLIKDNFGWNDMHFAIVLVLSGLGVACFQLLAFPRVVELIGPGWCLCSGAALGVGAFVLLPEKSLVCHICAMILFTLSGACLEPSFPVLVGLFASERHLGIANGIVASCRALATMLSPLFAGMLYQRSPRLAYHTAASCFAISALTAAVISVLSRSVRPEAGKLMPEAHEKSAA